MGFFCFFAGEAQSVRRRYFNSWAVMERCDEAKRFAEAITPDFHRISKVHFSFFFFEGPIFFCSLLIRIYVYIYTDWAALARPWLFFCFFLPSIKFSVYTKEMLLSRHKKKDNRQQKLLLFLRRPLAAGRDRYGWEIYCVADSFFCCCCCHERNNLNFIQLLPVSSAEIAPLCHWLPFSWPENCKWPSGPATMNRS